MSLNALFAPFALKSLQLKNRIVMAPMTRSFSPNGVPGTNVAAYYRRRAEGQVGLILSEGTVVNRPASSNDPNIPHFYGEQALTGWQHVIDEVHAAGNENVFRCRRGRGGVGAFGHNGGQKYGARSWDAGKMRLASPTPSEFYPQSHLNP